MAWIVSGVAGPPVMREFILFTHQVQRVYGAPQCVEGYCWWKKACAKEKDA
jgi:hypothetical protein